MPTDAVGKFLAECKDLSIFLDDVHKKVRELEISVEVQSKSRRKFTEPSDAAVKLVEETMELREAIKAQVREAKMDNDKTGSFLQSMLEQVKAINNEVDECEQYMAEYGYEKSAPIDPVLFDIFRPPPPRQQVAETPAAAADFEPTTAEENIGDSNQLAKTGLKKGKEEDITSVFELGLSKDTLKLLTGCHTGKPVPSSVDDSVFDLLQSANSSGEEVTNIVHPFKLSSAFSATSIVENSYLSASPALCMRKVPPSTTEMTETVEISPGLFSKRSLGRSEGSKSGHKSRSKNIDDKKTVADGECMGASLFQAAAADSPVLPTLHSFDLRALADRINAEPSTASAQNIISSKELSPASAMKDSGRPSGFERPNIEMGGASPELELPVLNTINLRDLLNKEPLEKLSTQSKDGASPPSARVVSSRMSDEKDTGETLRELGLSEETLKDLGHSKEMGQRSALPNVPEMSSPVGNPSLDAMKKFDEVDTPELPVLHTMNLRDILSQIK